MKTILCMLLFAVTTATLRAAGAPAQHVPIRPVSDCLRIDQINEWHIVNDRTAIVRTGPKRYRVDLQSSCPRLGTPPAGLRFRANPSNQALGESRICGEAGETVRSHNQPPCAIQSLTPIDKREFDRLAAHAKRSGSAADQPTAKP